MLFRYFAGDVGEYEASGSVWMVADDDDALTACDSICHNYNTCRSSFGDGQGHSDEYLRSRFLPYSFQQGTPTDVFYQPWFDLDGPDAPSYSHFGTRSRNFSITAGRGGESDGAG